MIREIQYFPLKENEIKEILGMVKNYSKNDIDAINLILSKHNCNEIKSNNIKQALKECVEQKREKIFDVRYGVCIARVQMMYRGNFTINDLSITGLIRNSPFLHSYIKSWNELLKLKQNNYEFRNCLEEITSSGMYLPFESIERLYHNYYFEIKVKKTIDTYFGEQTEKFMKILDYCLNEKCGLLEAVGIDKKQTQVKNINLTEKSNENTIKYNNINKNNVDNVENNKNSNITNYKNNSNCNVSHIENKIKEIDFGLLISSLIGNYIAFVFFNAIIFELLEEYVIMRMKYINIGLIIWSILQIITHVSFWKITTSALLKNKKISQKVKRKINITFSVFLTMYLLFSGFFTTIAVSNRIENTIKNYEKVNFSSEYQLKLDSRYQNESLKKELSTYKEEKQIYIKNVEIVFSAYYVTYLITITSINYIMLIYLNKKLKEIMIM